MNLGIVCAQKEANNWYFGYNAGITFNTNPPSALTNGKLKTIEGCATMSAYNGRLLFYTDGISVWDSTHNFMPNGTGLKGDSSTTQAAIIVPRPDSAHIYYIFTLDDLFGTDGLQYSEVNMKLNSGKGDIVTNKKNIMLKNSICEKLCAVQHSNSRDYWVLVSQFGSDSFFAYGITGAGLNLTPVSCKTGFTIPMNSDNNKIGYLKISPNGRKIAYSSYWMDTLAIGDFDAASGKISNLWKIYSPKTYGIEFSSQSKFLYTSSFSLSKVFQYDLSAGNKAAFAISRKVIDSVYSYPFMPGAMQIGPDGKIYLDVYASTYLSVIHAPDSLGFSCRLQRNYLSLAARIARIGLPNFFPTLFQKKTFQVNKSCNNDSVNFEISYTYNLDSVKWNFDDPGSGINNTSLKSNGVYHIYKNSGYYNVRLISYFKSYKDTIIVRFYYKNHENYLGKDTIICNSLKQTLKSNEIFLTYKWSNGSNASFISVSKTGSYILNVKDFEGCSSADTIQLTFSRVNSLFKLSDTLQCFSGNMFSFKDTSIFKDGKRQRITWYFGDSTFNTDTIITKTYANPGTYNIKLVVENEHLCKDSVTKTISVLSNANALFIVNDIAQCLNDNTFNFTSASPMGSGGANKYLWSFGDSTFSADQNIVVKKYNKDSIFTVRLIAAVNGTCNDTFDKSVIVFPEPHTDFSASRWSQCFKNNATDFVDLTVVKNGSYTTHWNLGDSSFTTVKNVIGKTYRYADSFRVTLLTTTNYGCRDSISKLLQIYPSVSAEFLVNKDIQCSQENIFVFTPIDHSTLNVAWLLGDGDSFQINGPASFIHHYNKSGSYLVRNISENIYNCKDTFTKPILVSETPIASFLIQDSLPCLNDNKLTVLLNSIHNNLSTLKQLIDWGDGSRDSLSGNGKVDHTYSKDNNYLLTLSSSSGDCSDSSERLIKVALLPSVKILVQGYCFGDTTVGTLSLSKGTGNNFNWQLGNTQLTETDSILKIIIPAIGTYQIKVSTDINQQCIGRDTVDVNIIEKPKADFSYQRLKDFNNGIPFQFTDQSTNVDGWLWQFGTAGNSNIQNPQYTFTDTGYISVRQIVSNQNICFDTIIKIIPVFDRIQFFFPNAFSPNGNGLNDDFGLNPNQYYLVKSYHLEIFNRWGEKVFQTDQLHEKWMGAMQGVYMFRAVVKDIFNVTQELTGAVEVLR